MKRRLISRERAELRWLLVHEAGCVDCLATHDDELRGELAREGRVLGVRIPRSLRHLLVVLLLSSACGGQAVHVDWVLIHELGHAGGLGHVEGTCMSAED